MPLPVDFYASLAHHADHLVPVWNALAEEDRGQWWCPPRMANYLRALHVKPRPGKPPARWPRLVAVAGFADMQLCKGHPLALIEHGAGQAYEDPHPSYSGGPRRDAVVLFLCPNEVVAARNRAAYPDATVTMVGSPRVDSLRAQILGARSQDGRIVAGVAQHEIAPLAQKAPGGPGGVAVIDLQPMAGGGERLTDSAPSTLLGQHAVVGTAGKPVPQPQELVTSGVGHRHEPEGKPLTVALSFHWPCVVTPECGWAFDHYEAVLAEVVHELGAQGHEVIGHGHPRGRLFFHRLWQQLGIEHLDSFDEVCARAGLYVCDNSSTLYEFAALGRPVVVLNSPRYRRGVMLWPRFWHCAEVGVQVNEPAELLGAIELAATDPPWVAARRAEVVQEVYPLQDGSAADRAAHALVAAAAVVQ